MIAPRPCQRFARAVLVGLFLLVGIVAWASKEAALFTEKVILGFPTPGQHTSATPASAAHSFDSRQPLAAAVFHYQTPRAVEWYKQELSAIASVGIDILLLSSGSNPADKMLKGPGLWNYTNLTAIIAAMDELTAEGRPFPRIGMLYHTGALRNNPAKLIVDILKPEGIAWFYVGIRDFFSLIPVAYRAHLDGKPLLFIHSVDVPGLQQPANDLRAAHFRGDFSLFRLLKERFAADFGGVEPSLVLEKFWFFIAEEAKFWYPVSDVGMRSESFVTISPGGTAQKTAHGRSFFEEAWKTLFAIPPAHRPHLVILESWNDVEAGTEIRESSGSSTALLDLTRSCLARWKRNEHVPFPLLPELASGASITFGPQGRENGITYLPQGPAAIVASGSDAYLASLPNPRDPRSYLCFRLDQHYLYNTRERVILEVEWDGDFPNGAFQLEYDSWAEERWFAGAYKKVPAYSQSLLDGPWKKAVFHLEDARFGKRQIDNGDFRFGTETPLRIRRLTLRKALAAPFPDYSKHRELSLAFGSPLDLQGLQIIPYGRYQAEFVTIQGSPAVSPVALRGDNLRYQLYFDVPAGFLKGRSQDIVAEFEVHFAEEAGLLVFYDALDEPHKRIAPERVEELGAGWKRFRFLLRHAYFGDRNNFEGDFQVTALARPALRRAVVRLSDLPPEALDREIPRKTIVSLFLRILQRPPRKAELTRYLSSFQRGELTARDILRKLLLSSEYRAKWIRPWRNDQVLRLLVTNILDRPATPADLARQTDFLGIKAFDAAILAILDSPEYKQKYGLYGVPGGFAKELPTALLYPEQ